MSKSSKKTFSTIDNIADIHQLLDQEITQLNHTISERLSSDVALINQISHYIIDAGGKRLRPLILILSAKALNYTGNHHILLAAVIELIHTATLLHDDVVDESTLRRNAKTANEMWGNAASVLVGDFLYSRAFEMMVEPDKMSVMQILAKTTNTIAQGEVLQLLHTQNLSLGEQDYLQMIERKTACLFEASATIGAVLSGANEAGETWQNALSNYGLNLGMAFQIADDVLDYTSTTSGKTLGDDLREGKITLPIIVAMAQASDAERHYLEATILEENITQTQIKRTIAILKQHNAFDRALEKAEHFAQLAKQSLNNLTDSEYKNALLLLTDLAAKRQS